MNLIQYRNTDKLGFYLLIDVPKNPRVVPGFGLLQEMVTEIELEDYAKAFKLCEEKAIRIDNPEVLPVSSSMNTYYHVELKFHLQHNDTFPLPQCITFKEKHENINSTSGCLNKVIHLSNI